MLTNIYVNCELISNKTKISFEYDTDNEYVSININKEDINHIDIKDITNSLKSFGLTDDEISKIILFKRYETISHEDIIFKLSDYQIENAKTIMSQIINNNTDIKLTDSQIKLLKNEFERFIDYNKYVNLSDSDKDMYLLYKSNHSISKENYKFINAIIIKYQSYIDNINLYSVIKNDSNVSFDLYFDNGLIKSDIRKYMYHYDINMPINITAVPIIELNNEFNKAFKDFDENRFIDELTTDLIKDFKSHIVTKYVFKLNPDTLNQINEIKNKVQNNILNKIPNTLTSAEKELIQIPNTIIAFTPDEPNNYVLASQYNTISDEYENILKNVTPKPITLNNILYVLQFIDELL